MFVRFRAVRHRLVVNLVATRRAGGKIVSEHIARLGSVRLPEPISAAERILFWRDLKGRWRDLIDRLGNRVSADDRQKALAAIDARIPKPTEADWQEARIATMRDKVETWEGAGVLCSNRIEDSRQMIDLCNEHIAGDQALADEAAQKAHTARMLTLKLSRGERIEGDDEMMLSYVANALAGWDADIRAEPRPAARGRRGRRKRSTGLAERAFPWRIVKTKT